MDDFSGTYVLVHPGLADDPVQHQGRVGTVNRVMEEHDAVFVDFPDRTTGIYSHNALLALKPPGLMLQEIRAGEQLGKADWHTVLQIYLLQVSGKPDTLDEAFKLAMVNTAVLSAATISLQDWIHRGFSGHTSQRSR